jgi:hypothetical protein
MLPKAARLLQSAPALVTRNMLATPLRRIDVSRYERFRFSAFSFRKRPQQLNRSTPQRSDVSVSAFLLSTF